MKTQKAAYQYCAKAFIITLICSIVIYYFPAGIIGLDFLPGKKNFCFTIISGISASFFVTALSTFIMYKVEMSRLVNACIIDYYWIKIGLNTLRALDDTDEQDFTQYKVALQDFASTNFNRLIELSQSIRCKYDMNELQTTKTVNKLNNIRTKLDSVIKWAKHCRRSIAVYGLSKEIVSGFSIAEQINEMNSALKELIDMYIDKPYVNNYYKRFLDDVDLNKTNN